jgi:sRNA-binding regulator protein Hfq
MGDKNAHKPFEQALLEEKKYFDLVLVDGRRLSCKYLGGSRYNLHLETEEAGTILVYKHSIMYVILEPPEEDDVLMGAIADLFAPVEVAA